MGIFELIQWLETSKADYVLVGGLAVALHGYVRNTMDVDVVLAMDEKNLKRFIDGAKAAGLQPVVPVTIDSLADPELLDQWYREKGMLAFGLRGSEPQATVIDVLIRPVISFSDLKRDAVSIAVGASVISVASIDHLIAMKTGTGRGKDLIDIEELTRIKQEGAHDA